MAIAALLSVIYVQSYIAGNAYGASIKYTISRDQPGYDYSCDEPVYGIYVSLSNNGTKTVSYFSVAITNPLCAGSVPPLPSDLTQFQALKFYVYSTAPNGTVTISGNNTLVEIKF
jgi:hypothetical protein